jgi:transcriptional regulator with XRE-family HTH domain
MARTSARRGRTISPGSDLNTVVGEVLRRHRLDQGMTQEQLAWQTGVERAFISELERGVKGASIAMLFRLAQGLQIKAGTIIAEVEDQLNGSV